MGDNVKEEQQAATLSAGGDAGQNNKHGGCRGRNHWNNTVGAGESTGQDNTSAKFQMRNKELPEKVIFNNTGQVDAANFQCFLKGMENYLYTTYNA